MSRFTKVMAAVLVGASACVAVGCGVEAQPEPARDVDGSPVTLEHGVVTSQCFSFETPDPLYLLQPDAQSCQAVINFDRGYGSMAIRVAAVTGYGHAEDYFDKFVEHGHRDVEMARTVVAGIDAHVITWTDPAAGQRSMYHVPFPAERHASGVPITHVTITGTSGVEFYSESLEMVVNSFEPVK